MRLQHVLSLTRPLLGLAVLVALARSQKSPWVAPAVLAAVATDFADGALARRHGQETRGGLYLDNICDAVFLALAFAGFALAHMWSRPVGGSAVRYWEHANWLPLIALMVSFGSYVAHWAGPVGPAGRPTSSAQGHSAGVANYVLCILGGLAVFPGVALSPWILEPSFVTVALLNLSAGADNLVLLVFGERLRRISRR